MKTRLVFALPGKGVLCDDTPRQVLKDQFVLSAPEAYLLLCLFFLNLFLRLCVAILCPFFFFPLGIALKF